MTDKKETSQPFDDSALKESIGQICKHMSNLQTLIPSAYNDSEIKREIKNIKLSIKDYDDSAIKKQIKLVEDKIPSAYDDLNLKLEIKRIEKSIPGKYDDSNVNYEVNNLKEIIETQSNETAELKKVMASMQKEIRSNRKEAGYKIDVVEQKINTFTEIK
jgi:hypothetical protein